jgi:integrase
MRREDYQELQKRNLTQKPNWDFPISIRPRELYLAACTHLSPSADINIPSSSGLAAGIRRVKGARRLGVRLGNWLTAEQARTLCQLPNAETVKGKRDRAILSILLGCGLRRRELAELTLDHLQQREDHWAVVDLIGKAGHMRTVPVPDWVKQIT